MIYVSDYQAQYNAWLAKTNPSPFLQGFTYPVVSVSDDKSDAVEVCGDATDAAHGASDFTPSAPAGSAK